MADAVGARSDRHGREGGGIGRGGLSHRAIAVSAAASQTFRRCASTREPCFSRAQLPSRHHSHSPIKSRPHRKLAGALGYPRAARVHTFHGTLFGDYFGAGMTAAIVRAERFLGHRTDRIVALSDAQRTELLAHRVAPANRIETVPLGVDFSRFGKRTRAQARQLLSIPPDQAVLVAAGRMVPIKRLDRLIDVFSMVRRLRPAHLYLVGDGSERAVLEARARESGLAADISFVGWVDEAADWYAAADVVVLTSDREGTPLALIEAAAAERPVVATDVGGVRDVVHDGETGFLVPADDIVGFADRVARLLADPGLAERFGSSARGRERYAAGRLIDALDLLYRSMLSAGPTR